VLLQPDQTEDALSMLERGVTPKLKSLQLHNGTSYTWNRLCYGVHDNVPHIRIECRYLPAGPTLIDEMANFAFWIGLMKGQPEELRHFYETLDFRIVKDNFIRAARTGINSVFNWLGKHYPARALILEELLPLSAKGLSCLGVDEHSAERLLKVIEARVQSGQTGSEWAIENSRRLRKKYRPAMMSQILVQESLQFQNEDLPVSQWPSLSTENLYFIPEHHRRVEHLMQSDILSIHQQTSMEVAESVMQWNKIHHLPVESEDGELVGFVDAWSLESLSEEDRMKPVGEFVKPTFAITPDAPLTLASRMMEENDTTYLAVMEDKRLVGIITRSDL
jgi:CBS domain-containing protein